MGVQNIILGSVLTALAAAAPIQKRIAANSNLAVALPLYSYPLEGVWEPTYNTIASNPQTTFDVIINPSNGPLADIESDYLAGVTKLNSYDNVKVFGYFKVDWAARSIDDAKSDIDIYASYITSNKAQLAGLFVDEAPHETSDDSINYMKEIHDYVRSKPSTSNFQIWTNPGTIVDAQYYQYADTVTAFEDTHDAWMTPERKAIPWDLHSQSSVMIRNWDGQSQGPAAQAQILIQRGFKSGFVWGNEDYTEWSGAWKTFSDSCKADESAGGY
jgi:hypothetical protein